MLAYINADAKAPESVCVISKSGCPFCAKAKEDLNAAGMAYEEIVLGKDASLTSLRAVSGKETVPQIFINGKHIGGSKELDVYLAR
jgi:glutaredoxin-like protein